ncbi:MAG: hypothetical protein CMM44_05965 [Rhodospirillaceae bacterium]|nr:hypothetical protein [Rhodospirillaceae bacterium]|tara:strand:- start:4312 stop:4683 length:372 start_codon:yes stop_codon:yes gene_type:complete
MLDFIASNALLAPLPISVLISAFLILLLLITWVIPLEKRVKRAENQLIALQRKIHATSNMQQDGVKRDRPREFSFLYEQGLSGHDNPEGENLQTLNKTGQSVYSASADLGKKSMQRRNRINKA